MSDQGLTRCCAMDYSARMNRRLFVTRALAGLATIPLIGRLVKARPEQVPLDVIQSVDNFRTYENPCLYDCWRGDVVEPPLVFNRVLTEQEIAAIHDYYSRKYGIPVQDVRITKLS